MSQNEFERSQEVHHLARLPSRSRRPLFDLRSATQQRLTPVVLLVAPIMGPSACMPPDTPTADCWPMLWPSAAHRLVFTYG